MVLESLQWSVRSQRRKGDIQCLSLINKSFDWKWVQNSPDAGEPTCYQKGRAGLESWPGLLCITGSGMIYSRFPEQREVRCSFTPITRPWNSMVEAPVMAFNYSTQLQYLETRSDLPSLRFVSHNSIYEHVADLLVSHNLRHCSLGHRPDRQVSLSTS